MGIGVIGLLIGPDRFPGVRLGVTDARWPEGP